MKKLILYISFLIIVVNACNNNKNNFVNICVDYELEVYQYILPILYSIDFVKKYEPVLPPDRMYIPLFLKEKEKYDIELAEYNSKIDTVKKYLFISDTLDMVNILLEFGNNIGCFNQIENCSNIIEQLCDSIDKLSLIPVNKNIINFDFYDKFGFKEEGLYVGMLSLSKVLFNDDYTEGCLSYSFVCGGKCAIDMLLIVEKSDNKWKIKKKITLGVS